MPTPPLTAPSGTDEAAPPVVPAPTFRDRVEYVGLRAVAGLLRLMPLETASAFMGRAWRAIAPFNARHRRALANLAFVMPELSDGERRAIVGDMWENLGRVTAETVLIDRILAEPDRIAVALDPADFAGVDLSRGAILVSLHAGNWELAAAGTPTLGLAAGAVYRKVRNPLVERYLLDLRRPLYPAGLVAKEGTTALRLRRVARPGTALCVLADLRDFTGITIDFMGRPAKVATFPAVFARRLGLPLIAARVIREANVHFRIVARPLPVPRTADVDADVEAATHAINDVFEEWIRAEPGSWMWGNRKWIKVPAA